MAKKTKITEEEGMRAIQFITDRLEDSQRYDILEIDAKSVKLKDKDNLVDDSKTIEVFIANALRKVNDVRDRHRSNAKNSIYTIPVFYKDGQTCFVPLFKVSKGWMHHKTLKRYTARQKRGILKLREKEEIVMQHFGKRLFYYQPETTRLPESIRDILMSPVAADYTHIKHDNNAARHVVDGSLYKTFKLPREMARITKDLTIVVGKVDHMWRGKLEATKIPYQENKHGQLIMF